MTIEELLIKLGVDSSGFRSGMTSATTEVKTLEKGVTESTSKIGKNFDEAAGHGSKFGGILSGISAGIGLGVFSLASEGISKVIDVVGDAEKAYQDAAVSTAQMSTALKNNVPAAQDNVDAINKVIDANLKYGFSADDQRSSLALLVGTTHDVAAAQQAQAAAMDLARLKGISLGDATNIMIKASEGQTRGLKAVGIEVDKNATFTDVLAAVTKTAGGQAAAYAETSAGKMAAAHAKVTEAMVKLGAITDKIVQAVMPGLADAFDNIMDAIGPVLDQIGTDLPPILATLSTDVGLVVAAIEPFVQAFVSDIPGAITTLEKAFGPLINDVFGLLKSTFDDITSNSDSLTAVLTAIGIAVAVLVVPPFLAWAAATLAATWPIVAIVAGVAALIVILDKLGVLKVIGATIKDIAAKVMPTLTEAFKTISKAVGDFVNAAMPPLTQAFNIIMPIIKTLIETYIKVLSAEIGFIANTVIPALSAAFDWIVKNVLPPVMSIIKTLIDTGIKVLGTEIGIITGTVLPALGTAFKFITDTVIPAVQTAFKTMGDVIGTVWTGISSAVKTAINIVIGAIDAIIGGINAIQVHIDLKPPIGPELKFDYNGPNLQSIPYLHSGGIVPGPAGADVLTMLQAGERVTSARDVAAGAGRSVTNNVTVNNPVPEPASSSVQRTLLTLQATGHL